MIASLIWILLLYGFSVLAVIHILLNKQDPRAALGWIAVCLGLPGFGAFGYWLLGCNRIRTRARSWQSSGSGIHLPANWETLHAEPAVLRPPFQTQNYTLLRQLSDEVTRRPLVDGNRVDPLFNGEQAYPAMLEAIEQATKTICLSTYIFDTQETGRSFAASLIRAAQRGVEVRVLVDALGELYTWPRVRGQFRSTSVRFALFLPFSLSRRGLHTNLRNHRKLLIVDGQTGFTGGMNISRRHCVQSPGRRQPVVDVHFQIRGPVVSQMHEAFLEDWHFTTGEMFQQLHPLAPTDGTSLCRGVSAGPNEEYEKLVWIISGALSCARRRVAIMVPYFIPDQAMIVALCGAALRGVVVEIILPERNNLPFVAWASRASFEQLLQYGVRIAYQPGPFNHSKLVLMDEHYALIGSANLDPRSLRLNFEFNLEVYDEDLNRQLQQYFDQVLSTCEPVTCRSMQQRRLPLKLRDSFFRLFTPFL
ncbi:MAG: cardiolipin synthase [Desulfuromonadaceae bacterium]|nr:cardiolipin synthase [Desulfuromonadaceae bacterium]